MLGSSIESDIIWYIRRWLWNFTRSYKN